MATDSQSSRQTVLQTAGEESLLDAIVKQGRLGQTPDEQTKGKKWVKEVVSQVLAGVMRIDADTDRMLGERIKQLDELISNQLNEVMHCLLYTSPSPRD